MSPETLAAVEALGEQINDTKTRIAWRVANTFGLPDGGLTADDIEYLRELGTLLNELQDERTKVLTQTVALQAASEARVVAP